jgi:hypothetical protein
MKKISPTEKKRKHGSKPAKTHSFVGACRDEESFWSEHQRQDVRSVSGSGLRGQQLIREFPQALTPCGSMASSWFRGAAPSW